MEALLDILNELHPEVDFTTHTSLIDDKVLDSFDIVTIVAEVNGEYDVAIPAEELRADLFKVGHHGQLDGADEALLDAVQPEAVVCCASSDRRYNSAHPDILRMITQRGGRLYFSDCPAVPDGVIGAAPHQALEFTVNPAGVLTAAYLAEV